MMAAGAESPSVATQSAKTENILQKIGQAGNNHQNVTLTEESCEAECLAEKTPNIEDSDNEMKENMTINTEVRQYFSVLSIYIYR